MFNVRDFGAKGDGKALDTKAFQEAVNKASKQQGGTVYVPSGQYLISNIYLLSNVHLELALGAELLASPDLSHYDKMVHGHNKDRQPYHLFIANDQKNIVISGHGVVNGQGPKFWKDKPDSRGWYKEKQQRISPLFELNRCENIKFIDFSIIDSPGWTVHLNQCVNVKIRGLEIKNHILGPNTDALDVNGCKNVIISDCHIEAGDDAIVLKTTPDASACEGITVTNCLLRSNCVGFKLGAAESFYDMRQITFSNSVIYKSTRPIGIYALEGGHMEDITISNIVCDTHGTETVGLGIPIHLDLRRRRDDSKLGAIRNIQISNLIARTRGKIMLTAEAGAYLENIVLRDVHLIYNRDFSDPQQYRDWLSAQFSNRSPKARVAAAALVAKGVKGFYLDNYKVTWPTEESIIDSAALWLRDIKGGYVNCPLLKPYKKALYNSDNCDITLID